MMIDPKELEARYRRARIRPEHKSTIDWYAGRMQKYQAIYEQVSAKTGVPWWLIGCIHALESSFNFSTWLANGDSLNGATVRVPKGLKVPGEQPPYSWGGAALVSLQHDGLLQEKDWSLGKALYHLHAYNGWGYITGAGKATTPPQTSPYLWSMTSEYEKGKYTSDGIFDKDAVSRQAGCVAIIKELEARGLVTFGGIAEGDEDDVTWFNAHLLQTDNKHFELGLVAKLRASDDTFATCRIPIDQAMVNAFLKRFPNATNILVAEKDKPWPGEITTPDVGFTKAKLAEIAEKEAKLGLGWRDNTGASKYGQAFFGVFGQVRFAWCGAFCHYCCSQVGLNMPIQIPGDRNNFTWALADAWQGWAERNGFWVSGNSGQEPKAGWIVLFDWQGAQFPDRDQEDHIGVYTGRKTSSGKLICAEGNVNDHGAIKERDMSLIQGFVVIPDGYRF